MVSCRVLPLSPPYLPPHLLSLSSGLARFTEFYLLLELCIHHFGSLTPNLGNSEMCVDAQKQEGKWRTAGIINVGV